jgi:purine-binding chemotaxis protein CheW
MTVSLGAQSGEERPEADDVQVLEFGLNGQRYCVGLDKVAEIVDKEELTTFPDTEEHVAGVMDLRGETTTIIDPKVVFDLEETDADRRVIIYDGDQRLGWLVDQVYQVTTIRQSDVEPQADSDSIRGLVNRDRGFLIWVDPAGINGMER